MKKMYVGVDKAFNRFLNMQVLYIAMLPKQRP